MTIMEWLQNLLDSSTTPVATAFILGLLTAMSPCPLATNIAAYGSTNYWVENVAPLGTFVKDATMSDWTSGVNGVPVDWTVQDAQ